MLEGMGHPVTRDSLERIGINYDFGKKTFCIYLFYLKNSKKSTTDAPSLKKDSTSKEQTKEFRLSTRRDQNRSFFKGNSYLNWRDF